MFTISEQPACSYIVGQDGKQQGIFSVVLEHHQTLHQVCPKQGIRLPFRHRRHESFSGQKPVSITHIGIVLPCMQTLEVLDADNGTLERREREQEIATILSGKSETGKADKAQDEKFTSCPHSVSPFSRLFGY